MTPLPSEPDPAGNDRLPAADTSGAPTEPLPPHGAPTQPLPPHATAAGSHRIPGPESEPTPRTGTEHRPGGFFTWVRSLGVVRGGDRWIGGVASGTASRIGLDPILVRGLFVVLALFGVGLLLYGLAWAFLPEPDGRIHAEEALRGTWTTGTTGALTAIILGAGPSLWWADDGWFGGFFFWPLFWVAGVGFLIYWLSTRSRNGVSAGSTGGKSAGTVYPAGTYPAPSGFGSAGPGSTGPGSTGSAPAGPGPAYPTPAYPARPSYPAQPGSGGYGGAPDRAARPGTMHRRTSPGGAEVALVLGAVLLTAGIILTLDYTGVMNVGSPVGVALAGAAVVNGLAIVVLGAMGRSSGVLGLTAVVVVVSAAATGSGIGSYANVVVANQADWAPDSTQPATGGYALAAGDGELDLRYLSDAGRSSVEVPVTVAASDMTILVPNDIPVLVRTDMLAGNVAINDGDSVTESGSIWRSSERKLNGTGTDPLVVHVKGFASNVLVTVNESDLER
jgi:phage shock protein PspC (stress-responsive transcriptional regulator)